MRRRNGNYSDFNSLGYLAGLIAAIAVYVVVIFLVLGSNEDSQKSYESKLAYNARAEAFNAQPITFRYAVSEFFPDINTEDYLLSILEIDEESPRERLPLYLTGWSIIMMMAVSLCFLVNYWQDCRAVRMGGKYFLADLPWYKPKYGFILIPMFGIPWIVLLVSFVRMKIFDHKEAVSDRQRAEAMHQHQQLATERENTPSAENAEDENSTANNEPHIGYAVIKRRIDPKTREQYIEFATTGAVDAFYGQLHQKRSSLSQHQSKLEALRHEMISTQKEMGETQAELRRLETIEPHLREQITSEKTETFAHEWEEICQMRGIVALEIEDDRIRARIEARVPYQSTIYDFGDFLVTFRIGRGSSLSCNEIRSGVFAHSDAVYRLGKSAFCFGDRDSEIQEHIDNCQICAALALIVDCIHAVNKEHESLIPATYYEAKKEEVGHEG